MTKWKAKGFREEGLRETTTTAFVRRRSREAKRDAERGDGKRREDESEHRGAEEDKRFRHGRRK